MGKPKIFQNLGSNKSVITRSILRNDLMARYYGLYMNNFTFEGDIDYQQKEFVLRRLWADGQIACFKLKELEGSKDHPHGLAVFTPFAAGYWNIYDYPVKVNLINTRGVRFIPVGLQEVDKDVVIGYAQRNKKPVKQFVITYVERMVDVLMVINTNLKVHKMPWLIGVNPEDAQKFRALMEKLNIDDPELYVDSGDIDKLKALVSGAPYIIDKLYSYYCALDNELREYLGFQNIGVAEKKEHLISNEVEANNSLVKANQDSLLDSMKEFFQRVEDVLRIHISVDINKNQQIDDIYEEESEEEKEVQDNE